MKKHPLNGGAKRKSVLTFFLLVFLIGSVFWVVGPVVERFLPEELPVDLPISSLMACSPIIAAVILVRREEGSEGVKSLFKRAFDYRRIKRRIWYVPILGLMPAMMVLEYGLMKVMGVPLPEPQIPVLTVLISFVVFFVAALGEEVGWQGYAIDPLQDRWNALTASIILGIVWALWHVVPLIQMNRAPSWIAWWCLGTIATRILIVWLYNNTGKSVFAAILFHAMINVTTVLLPSYGWPYDPFVAFVVLAITAAIITFLWGPKTLARFRTARLSRDVPSRVAN